MNREDFDRFRLILSNWPPVARPVPELGGALDSLRLLISDWGAWTDEFLDEIQTYQEAGKEWSGKEWEKAWDRGFITYQRLTVALVDYDPSSLAPLWDLFAIIAEWKKTGPALGATSGAGTEALRLKCRSLLGMLVRRLEPNSQVEAPSPDPPTIKTQAEASMGQAGTSRLRLLNTIAARFEKETISLGVEVMDDPETSVNEKLERLSGIFPSLLGLQLKDVASLLLVSPPAIHKTDWWQKTRKKDREKPGERGRNLKGHGNEATADRHGTRMNPRDINHNG